MEFNEEDMLLDTEETGDDADLEAELLALTGEAGTTDRKPKPKGQGECNEPRYGAGLGGHHWCWHGASSLP